MSERSHPENEAIRRETVKWQQEAEIARLRAENEQLRKDVKTAIMGDSAELADMKRENEKLQEKEKDYLEMLMRQAQTIAAQWKMIGGVDKMETGK